ncbi:hypothetical protein B9Z55_005336 [Caenorhabditis nigoni]|uniref:Uncharacterized protein n=1 Tax=Caenorhabditis nigoni TaxID=1611254 RepID=A0A2G5V0E6_9PELO|nr:hypothetical protein B9Z55_005336 [Caenorhabditis nigoni]
MFRGLSTELRNVLLGAFITFVCHHTVNKTLSNYYVKYKERGVRDPDVETVYKLYMNTMNKIAELVLSPVFQCTIGCPFEVIAKTRAIAGTMLMDRISFYCRDHRGAWNFLSSQNALFRGCTWFFRSAAI